MTPEPTRRALLTGAIGLGGLVVGAGATVAGEALAGSSPSAPASHVPSPGEELMVEHGVLKRVLLAYRAIGEQLADGRTPPAGAVADAAAIITTYVESFHEGLEEAYVFPRVREQLPDLVRTLLVQHDRGRHLTAEIATLATRSLTQPDVARRLAGDLAAFVRMYEPHEAWEDTVVYPALRAATPQPTLELLAERFADLENAQFGDAALRTILDRVEGIEQQLGIADLAAFTPDSGP